MQYCPVHHRGLMPGGWDPYTKRMIADTWRPVRRDVYGWAQVMARAFPQEVQMQVQPCDQCPAPERQGDGSLHLSTDAV